MPEVLIPSPVNDVLKFIWKGKQLRIVHTITDKEEQS